MTAFVVVSALTFVLYLQTGAYMLWKNPQAPLNRWFFGLSLYLAVYSLGSMLLLSEGIEGMYASFVRKSGWGFLFMLLFRFHAILTGYPRNRLYHDILLFFFISFGAGLSLFLYAVLFSFEPARLYLLEDWFWTNQFVDAVYYLVMFVFLVSIAFMYLHWRKGVIWKKEKKRFLIVFLVFTFLGPASIILAGFMPEYAVMNFVRMPQVYALPWFVSVSYGFVYYRFLPPDPAKASRKLLFELKKILFFCDRQGSVLETNPYTLQLTEKNTSEIKEINVRNLFVDHDKIEKMIQKTIIGGEGKAEMVTLRTPDGRGIPVLLSATLLLDRFGDEYGVALYGTDQRDAVALKQEIKKRKVIEDSLQVMSGNLELQVENHTDAFRRSLNETSVKIEARKKVEETVKAEIADMEVMMGEIHTRVKNNIGIILSLLQYKQKKFYSPKSRVREKALFQRINTILLINQQILTHDSYGLVNFKSFLESLVNEYHESSKKSEKVTISLRAAKGLIWVDQAIPLAIVANELINNSIQHAFVHKPASNANTEVFFSINKSHNCLLQVKDNGCGFPTTVQSSEKDYSGLQLVKMLVEDQLSGSFLIEQKEGVFASVSFPLDQQRQGHIGLNS